MTVSEEDRGAAVEDPATLAVIDKALIEWRTQNDPASDHSVSLSWFIRARLVSHGWGPKPTVSLDKLTDWVESVAYPDLVTNGTKGLARFLGECGIGVTP